MNSLKILLITSHFFTAEGNIAKGLAKLLTNHEVYFFSTVEIRHRRQEFEYLLGHVDVVHWLFNVAHLGSAEVKQYFEGSTVPRIAAVHHVCPAEMHKIKSAEKAEVIHVVSKEWQEFTVNHTSTKVISAHLGICPGDFRDVKTHPYKAGTLRIGMMGFYPGKYNRKRPDIAIEVFKELQNRNLDFEVILQGNGWEKFLPMLKNLIIPYTHIKVKSGKHILKFFERIHLYLCTSDYEGGPLPVLESLQAEVPVVSTDVGIARDALIQGGGILAPKGDVKALCDAIERIQTKNHIYNSLRKETSLVAQKFYWANLVDQYEQMYETTIKQWELNNKAVWQPKENKLNAFKQREQSLAYDLLGEVIINTKRIKKVKTLKLLSAVLVNRQIEAKRKISTVKEVVGTIIRHKKGD